MLKNVIIKRVFILCFHVTANIYQICFLVYLIRFLLRLKVGPKAVT